MLLERLLIEMQHAPVSVSAGKIATAIDRIKRPIVLPDRRLDETLWYMPTMEYLKTSASSTLGGVIQHVWPDFSSLPPAERSQRWFWMKAELQVLEDLGVLVSQRCASGRISYAVRC